MELWMTTSGATQKVTMSGRFVFADNFIFKPLMELAQNNSNLKSIDIDLNQLQFVDSAGMGMLLLLRDECEKRSIRIVLLHPQGQVQKMLDISRFDQLFIIQR